MCACADGCVYSAKLGVSSYSLQSCVSGGMTVGPLQEVHLMQIAVFSLVSSVTAYVVPPATLKAASYPEWAHYHWVWLSNDRASQTSMMQYAQEYLDHDIKVGAVDIDSGWSTGFNNFIFDTKKYPNATEMVEFFHSKGIRVILWATSMINTDSSNYKEAYDSKYFIRDVLGKQALFSWWHGRGGLLDYTNPDALQWWHQQMDKALAYGIDGWKCDGTDPYILELIVPLGKGGIVTRKQYSDAYYGDFFDYTQKKRGNETLIMSRPADGFGPIFLDFSPPRVMYSGWVGDNDPTFDGLEHALKSYLQSAWANYANFGSDIGGYRSGSGQLGRTKELLIRWAQLGAFSPLMENGGNKEHRPWKFDTNNQTLIIYRKFVDVHYQLVPYLLTTGSHAMDTNTSSITPLAKHNSFIEKLIDDFKPSTYNYLLGDDILVAPIISNSSAVEITFPSTSSWVYWWNHSLVYTGGSTHIFKNIPLDEFSAFFKKGTFIPLRVTEHTPVWGKTGFIGCIRWLLHMPPFSDAVFSTSVREQRGGGITISFWWSKPGNLEITISAHPTQQSLLELTGLASPPHAVLIATVSGSMMALPEVHFIAELKANSAGAYFMARLTKDCYVLHVYLGNRKLGHALKLLI